MSATPSKENVEWANERVVDMVIRPTHVLDPVCHVRPKGGQLEDLLAEVKQRAGRKERVLAVALTKRDAEDLASYLIDSGVRAGYIHSGLNTVERADALKSLQSGDIDCLVGVNLLREGLDLPQVSLVAILNADSEVSGLVVHVDPFYYMCIFVSNRTGENLLCIIHHCFALIFSFLFSSRPSLLKIGFPSVRNVTTPNNRQGCTKRGGRGNSVCR